MQRLRRLFIDYKTVSVPLADLRTKALLCSQDFSHDDHRNSQLLYGEKVEVLKEGEWNYVYVPMQGLFGFVHQEELMPYEEMTHVVDCFDDTLPYGSFAKKGRPLAHSFSREKLIEDALHFLGMPYLWGGCSPHRLTPIGSVDCSGLVHLLYRAQGILIPRDSGPQAQASVMTEKLLPGDLIYLGSPVCHVIMKLDEGLFIEAPETGKSVRLLKWGRDLWESEGRLHFSDREKSYAYQMKKFALLEAHD